MPSAFISPSTSDGGPLFTSAPTSAPTSAIDQNTLVDSHEALNRQVHTAQRQDNEMVPPRLQVVIRDDLPVE